MAAVAAGQTPELSVTLHRDLLSEHSPAAWDRWMTQHGAADFQHFYSYGGAMTTVNTAAYALRFLFEAQDIARALALRQTFGPMTLWYMPRGPHFAKTLDAEAQARQAVYQAIVATAGLWRGTFAVFSLSAVADAPFVKNAPILTGQTEAILQLQQEASTLHSGLRQKWRNRLHKAQKADLHVAQVKPSHADAKWLFAAEAEQRRAKTYRALQADLPAQLVQQPGRTKVFCFIARHQGKPVAGASFIVNSETAFYFCGVSLAAGRALCAQHLLIFEAAVALRAHGCRTLNLGTIDTHNFPGIARFKLGTGAHALHRAGTYLAA
ncbi:MAG: GNAT family N-acetyltransferase [Pseudomonadota bacterium]